MATHWHRTDVHVIQYTQFSAYVTYSAQIVYRGRMQDCATDPLHIQLAEWADVLVFAPLSANSLAKLALGLADNLACRLFRAWDISEKPVIVAPAMNTKMWTHPATAGHIETLCSWGTVLVKPVSKMLACGDVGVGAMASVGDILSAIEQVPQQTP